MHMNDITRVIKTWAVLCLLSLLTGGCWAEADVGEEDGPAAPAEGPEDVPNLGDFPEDAGEATDDQKANHAPKLFLTADPGWRAIEGTTTVTSPANDRVTAVVYAHGSDEDGDPLEYIFINYQTGRTIGPDEENWVVFDPYHHKAGSYRGKVIVKDTVSGQTAEAEYELVILPGDDDGNRKSNLKDSASSPSVMDPEAMDLRKIFDYEPSESPDAKQPSGQADGPHAGGSNRISESEPNDIIGDATDIGMKP